MITAWQARELYNIEKSNIDYNFMSNEILEEISERIENRAKFSHALIYMPSGDKSLNSYTLPIVKSKLEELGYKIKNCDGCYLYVFWD